MSASVRPVQDERSATAMPDALMAAIDGLSFFEDRAERIQALIEIAEGFQDVPERIARRPFDEARRVPGCESEVYVFDVPRDDGTLDFHFAVENPQGVTARALAVLLGQGLSGAPLDEVASIEVELIFDIFGSELSMSKIRGLGGIVEMAAAAARRELAARGGTV